MKGKRVRPGFVLALLVVVLAGALTINWPVYSPERFVRQLRLVEADEGIALNYPRLAWVRTRVTNYWNVDALPQANGIQVRIVLFERKSTRPWLFDRNHALGPRNAQVEWLRIEIELPGRIPRELWLKALENPDIISDLPVSDTYKAALRFHATGQPFTVTATPSGYWTAPGKNGLTAWINMKVVSIL